MSQTSRNASISLAQARVGKSVQVAAISDPDVALMAVRLGIFEGEILTISHKIPAGPMVVQKGQVEIALGHEICRNIRVVALNSLETAS